MAALLPQQAQEGVLGHDPSGTDHAGMWCPSCAPTSHTPTALPAFISSCHRAGGPNHEEERGRGGGRGGGAGGVLSRIACGLTASDQGRARRGPGESVYCTRFACTYQETVYQEKSV